jgi:hypothetical protein
MLGAVFERFVEKSPISVMVRAALERVLGADRLDRFYELTAQKQYTRDLLFSSIYDLMSQVVFGCNRVIPRCLNRQWEGESR